MIWELAENWRISVVPLNFILEHFEEGGINRKTGEQGKAKWVRKGYYSSLEKAISAIPSELAQHPEVKTFGDLSARLDTLARQISRRVGHG